MLDNWDFTNPVNQRGESSYSSYPNTTNSNTFSLDRWHLITGYLGVGSDHCLFGRSNSANGAILYQELSSDTIKSITGKTITASIKFSDGSYHSFTYSIPSSLPINTVLGSFEWTINNRNYRIDLWSWKADNLNHIQFRILEDELGTYSSSNRLKISAVKLELGSVSTLKNDLLGVSYTEELRKCQRYYYDSRTEKDLASGRLRMVSFNDHDSFLTGNVFFPVPMRAKPVITIYSEQGGIGNLNDGLSGEELKNLEAYAQFAGRHCFSQLNLNKALSQVSSINGVCFQYTASADL